MVIRNRPTFGLVVTEAAFLNGTVNEKGNLTFCLASYFGDLKVHSVLSECLAEDE